MWNRGRERGRRKSKLVTSLDIYIGKERKKERERERESEREREREREGERERGRGGETVAAKQTLAYDLEIKTTEKRTKEYKIQ